MYSEPLSAWKPRIVNGKASSCALMTGNRCASESFPFHPVLIAARVHAVDPELAWAPVGVRRAALADRCPGGGRARSCL